MLCVGALHAHILTHARARKKVMELIWLRRVGNKSPPGYTFFANSDGGIMDRRMYSGLFIRALRAPANMTQVSHSHLLGQGIGDLVR